MNQLLSGPTDVVAEIINQIVLVRMLAVLWLARHMTGNTKAFLVLHSSRPVGYMV